MVHGLKGRVRDGRFRGKGRRGGLVGPQLVGNGHKRGVIGGNAILRERVIVHGLKGRVRDGRFRGGRGRGKGRRGWLLQHRRHGRLLPDRQHAAHLIGAERLAGGLFHGDWQLGHVGQVDDLAFWLGEQAPRHGIQILVRGRGVGLRRKGLGRGFHVRHARCLGVHCAGGRDGRGRGGSWLCQQVHFVVLAAHAHSGRRSSGTGAAWGVGRKRSSRRANHVRQVNHAVGVFGPCQGIDAAAGQDRARQHGRFLAGGARHRANDVVGAGVCPGLGQAGPGRFGHGGAVLEHGQITDRCGQGLDRAFQPFGKTFDPGRSQNFRAALGQRVHDGLVQHLAKRQGIERGRRSPKGPGTHQRLVRSHVVVQHLPQGAEAFLGTANHAADQRTASHGRAQSRKHGPCRVERVLGQVGRVEQQGRIVDEVLALAVLRHARVNGFADVLDILAVGRALGQQPVGASVHNGPHAQVCRGQLVLGIARQEFRHGPGQRKLASDLGR